MIVQHTGIVCIDGDENSLQHCQFVCNQLQRNYGTKCCKRSVRGDNNRVFIEAIGQFFVVSDDNQFCSSSLDLRHLARNKRCVEFSDFHK